MMAVSSAWRIALAALLLVWLLVLLVYRGTAEGMVTIWYRSETFTHGFVVLPIALWLIWRRRQQLARLLPRPSPLMLIPLAGFSLMWLLGDLVAVNSVTQLALVAMLVTAVPVVLGLSVAAAIAFPLAFMFFAVPIGEFLMPVLMDWTADFTVVALRLGGIPVYREGLQFVIPSGNWSVVEACSGVRYLIASLTVGTLYAYLNYQSTWRRLVFILVSILVPIVANWLRAYMIVMLGHLSGNTLAVGVDHLIYGWAFFGVVIMLMFIIGARWAEPEPAFVAGPDGDRGADPATAPHLFSSAAGLWVAAVCAMLVVVLPTGAKWAMQSGASTAVPALSAPAALAPGWQARDPAPIGFKPSFENPSAEINSAYENSGQLVGLYLGYYRNQDYSRKLVSSTNVLVPSEHPVWARVAGATQSAIFGTQQVTVRSVALRSVLSAGADANTRLLVWQVYWINGSLTANDYLAKVYGALNMLAGRGDDSAVIVIYTDLPPKGDAQATLQSFMAANYGAIDALLKQAKASR